MNVRKMFACLIFLIILGLLTACAKFESSPEDKLYHEPMPEPEPITDPLEEETTDQPAPLAPPEPKVHRATLTAVGDIIVYSSMMRDAQTKDGYDFRYMFAEVKEYFEDADLVFANQESMIGGAALGLTDYPRFNSPFAIADALKELGVSVVSIANNHTLDRGEQAVHNAAAYWNELGIPYTGAYVSAEDASRIRTLTASDIKFAFLAYTYGTNGLPSPADKPWIVNRLDEKKIAKDIKEARELADIVVVSYHFGNEYERMPNEEQKKWAQLAADHGAHIVLGHHPHVLQPLEWLEQPNGEQTLVAYSLGNFLAAQDGFYKDLGGILNVTVEKMVQEEKITISIDTPSFIPTWIHKKNWREYRIIPLHQVNEDMLNHVKEHEAEIITHLRTWMPELRFPHNEPDSY